MNKYPHFYFMKYFQNFVGTYFFYKFAYYFTTMSFGAKDVSIQKNKK